MAGRTDHRSQPGRKPSTLAATVPFTQRSTIDKYMTTTRKLKIWTLATHAFIVAGFGHGIVFFFLIEILWFPFVTKDNITFLLNAPFESRLPVVGLTSLCGQIATLISILSDNKIIKSGWQIFGLILLWLSILYFIWTIGQDTNVNFATITATPFCICTLLAFVGQPIKTAYRWVVDNY